MAKKTLVGGMDGFGDDLPALLALLVARGILPKSWRSPIWTAGTVILIYKILKRLGWI